MVNQLLPEPGGIGKERAFGKDSHSALSPSWLTYLSDAFSCRRRYANGNGKAERAARRNNELPVIEPKDTIEVKQVGSDGKLSPQAIEPTLAEDNQSGSPLINLDQAPSEVQA